MYAQELSVFETQEGGVRKYGYKDKTGKVVLKAEYNDAFEFNEGLAAVKQGNLYGFIDPSGKLVIPYQYAYAESPVNGLAVVAYDSK